MASETIEQIFIRWNDLFFGEDEHSISRQLSTLFERHADMRILNLAGGWVESRSTASVLRNPILASLLANGYIALETLGVRRLVERGASRPEKQIISLRRFVEELDEHRKALTRHAYVTRGSVPYDPEPERTRWYKHLHHLAKSRNGSFVTTYSPSQMGFLDFDESDRRHRAFDSLSCTRPDQRSKEDLFSYYVKEVLIEKLEILPIKLIKLLSDKRVAHAADGHSRGIQGVLLDGLNFRDILLSHIALRSVAQFISRFFLLTDLGDLFAPRNGKDGLEFLETAGLSGAAMGRLNCVANALASRYGRQSEKQLELIFAEIHERHLGKTTT